MINTVPIDSFFGEILYYAVRHALNPHTFAAIDVCQYIIPLIPYLPDHTLQSIRRTIVEQAKRGYGNDCDEHEWFALFTKIRLEQIKRERESI